MDDFELWWDLQDQRVMFERLAYQWVRALLLDGEQLEL